MKFAFLLIMLAFASDKQQNEVESVAKSKEGFKNADDLVLVKIEEDEYTAVHKKYLGVHYDKRNLNLKWMACRRTKKENKKIYNGYYKDEETAAHASDTLARKLMKNGEQNHKLNFPDDNTEFYPNEKTSKYLGVSYCESKAKWAASRRSKKENKSVTNGTYKDEETAAHASDTLARKLTANGEQDHKLNFPDDTTEMYSDKKKSSSKYIGVCHDEKRGWETYRWSKNWSKIVHNGFYKNEERAAHASDTLARKLMANGEQNHKLNFPDDNTQVYTDKYQRNKRKRSDHDDLVSRKSKQY